MAILIIPSEFVRLLHLHAYVLILCIIMTDPIGLEQIYSISTHYQVRSFVILNASPILGVTK